LSRTRIAVPSDLVFVPAASSSLGSEGIGIAKQDLYVGKIFRHILGKGRAFFPNESTGVSPKFSAELVAPKGQKFMNEVIFRESQRSVKQRIS
jgi:hypothetical protein